MRKLICLVLSLALCVCFAGCSDDTAQNGNDNNSGTSTTGSPTVNSATMIACDEEYGFQLEQPKEGEQVALLHTNYGDIYIRLFPDQAPKAVENFTKLIDQGYYDGLIFHRVIENFCVQGGDPTGTGSGGESIWGEAFEDQFCDKLMNLSYSVAMANSGVDTNGSQFFINHSTTKTIDRSSYDYETMKANYVSYYQQYCSYYSDFTTYYPTVDDFINDYVGGISPDSRLVPEEVWKLYESNGGNISLDGAWRATGGHTVFGQVYAGKDIVDKIAAVEVDDNDKPVNDVVIETAELITVS